MTILYIPLKFIKKLSENAQNKKFIKFDFFDVLIKRLSIPTKLTVTSR